MRWFLEDPHQPGEYLRRHHSPKYGDKNRQQHQAFLDEVEHTPKHEEIVRWFLELPLWLDAVRWTADWLEEPNDALGGRTPDEFMDTSDGRTLVSGLVARMQSGAYA